MVRRITACRLILIAFMVLSGCTSLPHNAVRSESMAFIDTEHTLWGRLSGELTDGKSGESGFWLVENGLEALVRRLDIIDNAQRSLDVQYYLFHDDLTGRLVMRHLYQAADRGVRVRVLLDDIALNEGDHIAVLLDQHPNLELRVFNPFNRNLDRVAQMILTADMSRITRRMHNKALIADNQVAIWGSRNIGNSYFGADPKLSFQDLDVLSIGPTTIRFSEIFDLFWNSDLTYPISTVNQERFENAHWWHHQVELDEFLDKQKNSDFFEALEKAASHYDLLPDVHHIYWAQAEVLYDYPEKILGSSDKSDYYLSPQLDELFEACEKELIIVSPYFIPGTRGVELLERLVQRGVRVRILTNSLASTDVSIVHSGYAKFRKDLLGAGIELYELNKNVSKSERKARHKKGSSMASLHTKAIIFDRKKVFIGSLNLDPRAIEFNTEIGVAMTSAAMAEELYLWFDGNLDQNAFRLVLQKDERGIDKVYWHGVVDGQPQVFDSEPYSSVWRRLGIGIMSILPLLTDHL